MAGPFTHMLVSQAASDPTVVTTLDPALQDILLEWQPFLLLGSVGPDLPGVVDKLEPEETRMLTRLHKGHEGQPPTNTTVCELYAALRGGAASCAPFAFLMGYVSHTVTDVIVHPIVESINDESATAPWKKHRNCEMCQDSLIVQDYTGLNIKHCDYLSWLKLCKQRPAALDATLARWQSIIERHYGHYSCKAWIKSYETIISIAREAVHIDEIGYPDPLKIRPEERETFYDRVRLPDGSGQGFSRQGDFRTDVFDRAVHTTARLWQQIYLRFVDPADPRGIDDLVPDWDLDTGENRTTNTPADLWRSS